MTTITIEEATYQALTEQAQEQGLTVDQYLEQVAVKKPPLSVIEKRTKEERLEALREFRAFVDEQSKRFPPGFSFDCDRETIYREGEDSQL